MTVNDTIEQVKKLFTYVKASKAELPDEPQWKPLWLEERTPPPRELSPDEGGRFALAIIDAREGYLL